MQKELLTLPRSSVTPSAVVGSPGERKIAAQNKKIN